MNGPDTRFDEVWREHRSFLVDVAFRMLRDIGEAEDVVQSAYSQLLTVGIEDIDDARAWLLVVTSRLCLNRINSSARRREERQDPDRMAELPSSADSHHTDPADRVTLDDRVRLALLAMLEQLSPAERVVFVLHDVFATPFDAIATSVGRTPASCRQLAHRARRKLERASGSDRKLDVRTTEHRAVTNRFIAACAGGDLEELVAVLDPQVTGDSDYAPRVVTGAGVVGRNLLRYWSGQPTNFFAAPITLVSQPLAEQTALLAYRNHELAGVLLLDISDDLVTKIHVIGDAAKLAFIRDYLLGEAPTNG